MNIDELKSLGGFADPAPTKIIVSWENSDGQKMSGDAWIVRQSYGEIERAVNASEKDKSQGAMLISLCIRFGDDAKESLTYEQAYNLYPPFAFALIEAINEANAPKN
jgi:hypothetical protein